MKSLFVLLSLTAALVFGHQESGDSHGKTSARLIDLDQESFETRVVDPKTTKLVNGPWLIMFFAPWCGHCKRLMPAFDQFAETYGDGQNLNVGRVDCDQSENSNLCTAYDVGGFPTVLLLTGDHWYEFRGERTIDGFSKFVFDKGYEE